MSIAPIRTIPIRCISSRVAGAFRAAGVVFVAMVLAACQSLPQEGALRGVSTGDTVVLPAVRDQIVPELAATPYAALTLGWKDGALVAHDVMNGAAFRLGPVAEGAEVSHQRLTTRRGNVLAMWLETTTSAEGERSYVTWMRASRDGGRSFSEPSRLGREGAHVLQAEVAVSGEGEIWIVSLERDAESKRPELRLNRWGDGVPISILLVQGDENARWAEPRIALHEGRAWVAWVAGTANGGAIELLESANGGEVWTRRERIVETSQAVGMQLLRSRGHLLVTWMDVLNSIRGLVLADGPSTWQPVRDLPTRDEGLIGGYKATVAPDGAVHVLYTLRREQGDTHAIYHRRSDDGTAFSAAQRISTSEPAHVSSADVPVLAFDDEGSGVFATWLDLRFFRPTIYGNHSSDGGRSWLSADFPVSPQPGSRMAMFPSAAHVGDGRFAVAWTEWPDTRRTAPQLSTSAVLITPPKTTAVAPTPDPARLVERVSAYWQARVAGELSRTFPFYDPFYRERTTVEDHVSVRSRFKVLVHGFEVGEPTAITPTRYKVNVRFEHEVKPFDLPDGRKAEVPRDWVDTDQEWIWIDGDWHVVYLDLMRKPVVSF